MKILHITQGTIGGTLEYLKLLLPKLQEKSMDIEVICPEYGPMSKELKKLEILAYNINMEREISLKNDFKSILELRRYIKKSNCDIIHLHSTKAGALGRLANVFLGKKCIYTPHGWAFNMKVGRKKRKAYLLIEKVLSFFCDYVVSISKAEEESALTNKVITPQKSKLITNGIDIEKYENSKNKLTKSDLKIGNDKTVIGMVCRLSEQKNPLLFVEIASEIIKGGLNAHFIFIGDGELRTCVESKIMELGLNEYFNITGWVDDVKDYLGIIDVGVLTSNWEGFGLVLAEYMAAKIPVVASAVDGIKNVVVHNETGFLVEAGNKKDFVNAILTLLSNQRIKEDFVRNAYKRVEKEFNIERVVEEHLELYQYLIR
jgi:glycosyltransferase involved in cell wall biosynthesis